jgi:hypothetical protein
MDQNQIRLTEQKSQGQTSPTNYHAEINPSQTKDHPTNQHINKHQHQQVKSGHKPNKHKGQYLPEITEKGRGSTPLHWYSLVPAYQGLT